MGIEYTFYDYIDADGNGLNVINDWLNGEGKPAKSWFNVMLVHLESSSPPGFKDTFWKPPYAELLENKKHENWIGFIEIRKRGKVQYRLIAKLENRDVFLVAHGIHKGQNWNMDISSETARLRIVQMRNNPKKYRREHDNR